MGDILAGTAIAACAAWSYNCLSDSRMNGRINDLDGKLSAIIDDLTAANATSLQNVNLNLDGVTKKLESVAEKQPTMNAKLDRIETGVTALQTQGTSNNNSNTNGSAATVADIQQLLTDTLLPKVNEIEQLTKERDDAQQVSSEKATALSTANTKVERLQEELDHEKSEHDKTELQRKSAAANQLRLQAELDASMNALKTFTAGLPNLFDQKQKIGSFEEQLKAKDEEIEQLKSKATPVFDADEIAKLQEEKKSLDDEKARLEQQLAGVANLQQRVQKLTTELDAASSLRTQLEEELETVRTQKASVESSLSKARNDVTQLEQQVNDLNAAKISAESAKDRAEALTTQREQELKEMRVSSNATHDAKIAAEKLANHSKQELEELRSAKSKVDADLASTNGRISSLETTIDNLNAEKERLNKQLDDASFKHEQEVDATRSAKNEADGNLSVATAQINSLKIDVDKHEADQKALRKQLEDAESKHNHELENIQLAKTKAESELATANATITGLKTNLEGLNAAKADLDKKFEVAKTQHERDLDALRQDKAKSESELKDAKAEIAKLKERSPINDSESESLTQQLKDAEAKHSEDIKTLKSEHESDRKVLIASQSDVSRLQQRVNELESMETAKTVADSRAIDAEGKVEGLNSRMKQTQDQLNGVTAENKTLTNDLNSKTTTLNNLTEDNEKLQAKVERFAKQNREAYEKEKQYKTVQEETQKKLQVATQMETNLKTKIREFNTLEKRISGLQHEKSTAYEKRDEALGQVKGLEDKVQKLEKKVEELRKKQEEDVFGDPNDLSAEGRDKGDDDEGGADGAGPASSSPGTDRGETDAPHEHEGSKKETGSPATEEEPAEEEQQEPEPTTEEPSTEKSSISTPPGAEDDEDDVFGAELMKGIEEHWKETESDQADSETEDSDVESVSETIPRSSAPPTTLSEPQGDSPSPTVLKPDTKSESSDASGSTSSVPASPVQQADGSLWFPRDCCHPGCGKHFTDKGAFRIHCDQHLLDEQKGKDRGDTPLDPSVCFQCGRIFDMRSAAFKRSFWRHKTACEVANGQLSKEKLIGIPWNPENEQALQNAKAKRAERLAEDAEKACKADQDFRNAGSNWDFGNNSGDAMTPTPNPHLSDTAFPRPPNSFSSLLSRSSFTSGQFPGRSRSSEDLQPSPTSKDSLSRSSTTSGNLPGRYRGLNELPPPMGLSGRPLSFMTPERPYSSLRSTASTSRPSSSSSDVRRSSHTENGDFGPANKACSQDRDLPALSDQGSTGTQQARTSSTYAPSSRASSGYAPSSQGSSSQLPSAVGAGLPPRPPRSEVDVPITIHTPLSPAISRLGPRK